MESNNNDPDAPFAHLLSMGYSEMYIQRAIKVHKKSKFGTNWRLSILVQIIDQLQAIDLKNEKEYHSNLLHKKRNHQNAKSLHLVANPPNQPNHHNINSDISSIYEYIESLYMKAVSLYENKHYEECERVLKDVLRRNPNHCQAAFLYKDLVEQRLTRYNCNPEILKHIKPKKNSMLFGIANSIKKKRNTFKKSNDSDHPCRIEFKRFLRENIQLDKYYENLENKFVCAKYDDIRILKDFDAKMLQTEIGLKPLHCKLFMKKVEIFIGQVQIFRNWLADFVDISIDLLLNCLENNGILTFDTLYRRVKCVADLDAMIHINIENISSILWNEMESNKCVNKKRHIKSKTMEIHNDKKQSHAVHWGFTKGNNDRQIDDNVSNEEKLSDDQFIAALSPSAKSIEDMFMSYEPQLKKICLPTVLGANEAMSSTPMSISSYIYHSSEEKECETAYI